MCGDGEDKTPEGDVKETPAEETTGDEAEEKPAE